MTTPPGHTPEELDDDALIAEIKRLRDAVQAEFDSLTSDGDRSGHDARVAELDAATRAAKGRGLDVPLGK
ncbi:hypothetical protein [Williamsia maris]|nr:hypothetical protein [Williamsia maris]